MTTWKVEPEDDGDEYGQPVVIGAPRRRSVPIEAEQVPHDSGTLPVKLRDFEALRTEVERLQPTVAELAEELEELSSRLNKIELAITREAQ
jgi:hypothetical protein